MNGPPVDVSGGWWVVGVSGGWIFELLGGSPTGATLISYPSPKLIEPKNQNNYQ